MARYLGQYEVVAELGSGHFGTVYLATGEVPGKGASGPRRRLVAIKRLKNPTDQQARLTLKREFDLLDQVRHRTVCKVYEFLEDEGAVVMEYVHGRTLRDVLELLHSSGERMFLEAAVEIACEIADCLYQAYSTPGKSGDPLQIVHRDLKPENIMIMPEGEVRVLDFGLARVVQPKREDKTPKGTPLYMAPEQATGQAIDHRTDLFALGLVLFELLLGRPAYDIPVTADSKAIEQMRKRIAAGDLQKEIREIESKLPGPGPVVARCLQGNPKARYENGHDMMLDLRRQLLQERGKHLRDFCSYHFAGFPLKSVPRVDEEVRTLENHRSDAPRLRPSETRPDVERGELMANHPSRPSGPPRPSLGLPRAPAVSGRPSGQGPALPSNPPSPRAAPGGRADGLSDQPLAPKKKRGLEALRPDATGILKMEEMRDGLEDEELNERPPSSATEIFAFPVKKGGGGNAREVSSPPPKLEGASGRSLPGQSPMGISGPANASGFPAIAGPIASGPMAGQRGPGVNVPFMAPPSNTDIPDSENRGSGWTVWAILLGLVGLFLVTLVVTAGAIVGYQYWGQQEEPPSKPVIVKTEPEPPVDDDDPVDELPAATLTPAPQTPRPPRNPSPPKEASTTPPKAPLGATAAVKVTIPSDVQMASVEIKCNAVRQRASFSGGAASIPNIPTGEDCTIYFKGGAPAQYRPVRGGQNLSCTFVGTTANCR